VKLYNHAVAPNPRRVCILAAALRVTCNGGRPQVARPPVHPHVTRNGGVGPRHSSLSTSPSRTTLPASDPSLDHPQILIGTCQHDVFRNSVPSTMPLTSPASTRVGDASSVTTHMDVGALPTTSTQ
jgi:hypothetical protein